MKWSLLPWKRIQSSKSAKKTGKPKPRRLIPTFEQLEVRFMPSAVTLGLYNDTSIGAKFTSDGRLGGTISVSLPEMFAALAA